MTLGDLLRKLREVGDQFNTYEIPLVDEKEKKAKLTIEDIQRIDIFLCGIRTNKHGAFTFTRLTDEQYAEVLKRYLETKK